MCRKVIDITTGRVQGWGIWIRGGLFIWTFMVKKQHCSADSWNPAGAFAEMALSVAAWLRVLHCGLHFLAKHFSNPVRDRLCGSA